jgi:hypothetical protein
MVEAGAMRSIIALASLLFAGACATDETINYGETESHVESANRISSHRISSNRISSNRISSNGLIDADEPGTLIDSEGGRELLSYIVSCALPDGQSVTLSDSLGTSYTYGGSIGLAPSWYSNPATEADRRWVSACILARVNHFGVSVPISLRGTNAALVVDAQEAAAYSIREGAFYGDIFATDGTLDACAGELKLAGSQESSLPLRECTVSEDGTTTKCGFAYAGPCATACQSEAGNYTSCGSVAEVVTVYLATP